MNKTILISGGSDGLGKAIARELTGEGKVIILSNEENKLKACATELGCNWVYADVSDYRLCEEAVNKVVNEHGGIDCLVNCAGIWIEGELDSNEPDKIKKVLEVNTTGTINLTRAALPSLKQTKGTVVNVVSQAGLHAKAERSVYTASKWAITGFTKSLQQELSKKYNVKVVGLYPGKMKTKLFEKAGNIKDLTNAIEVEEVARAVKFILTLKDTSLVSEIGIRNVNE